MSDTTPSLVTSRWGKTNWMAFAAIAILLAAYATILGHAYIFGPATIETGDFAANALQILNARHFQDIYGNYSRWGFNHPGPFFFYVYAVGETVFLDWLKLVHSPDQAHVLAGIILQSTIFAWASVEFARITRTLNLVVFIAVAAFVLPHTLAALSSIWPPHVLLAPYFALIISCASLSLGNTRALVVAILMTCILCHGHVAQPLMTIPMLGLALAIHVWHGRATHGHVGHALRAMRTPLLISAVIIAIFLVPIAIDLSRCPDCNAYRILAYLHSSATDTKPNWHQAFNYIASFFIFDHQPQSISAFPGIPFFTHRVLAVMFCIAVMCFLPYVMRNRIERKQFLALRAMTVFIVLALVLSLIWAKRITGGLYEFNAFFVYAILLAAYLTISATLVSPLRSQLAFQTGFLLTIAAAVVLAKAPRPAVVSQRSALKAPSPSLNEPKVLALLTQENHDNWPTTVTLALWLARQDIPFMVPNDWAFLFGWNRALNIQNILASKLPLQIWYVSNASALSPGQTFDPSRFCHITNQTPAVSLELDLSTLDKLRQSCQLTTFGLPTVGKNPWIWTTAKLVALQFVGKHADGPVSIELDAFPFLGRNQLHEQHLGLYVNGSQIAQTDVTQESKLVFEVPQPVWNSSKVTTVLITLPDATSPSDLGLSIDSRRLGLGLHSLQISYGAQ